MAKPPRAVVLLWCDAPLSGRSIRLACGGQMDLPPEQDHIADRVRTLLDDSLDPAPTWTTPLRWATPLTVLGGITPQPRANPWHAAQRWTDLWSTQAPHLRPVFGPWIEIPHHNTAPSLDTLRDAYSRLPQLLRDPTRA